MSPARATFVPAFALMAAWIVWIPLDGGYFARDWYPGALFATALLGVVLLAGGPRIRSPRLEPALLALGALVAWSFLSMLWADWDGSAWHASNQLLLYAVTAALVSMVHWRAVPALVLLGAWSLGVAVACAGELVSALSASGLEHYILESRWQQPTGYANAAAALAAMALFPALTIASRRGVRAPVQALFLATAAFLAGFSWLAQSRASLIATILVVPLLLALSPHRGRLLARLLVLGLALALAADPVFDLYESGQAGQPLSLALERAARAILLSVAVAAAGALLLALAERRVVPGPRALRGLRVGGLATLALVCVVAAATAAVYAGEVVDYADERWAKFKSDEGGETRGLRLTEARSDKRYDYWRVSVDVFRDAPLTGAGSGNFEREYSIHRRHEKPSRAAHSIWFRALSEGGAVGAALLAAFVALVAVGLARARRGADEAGRAVVAACACVGAYFLVQSSVDWLELMPALAAPAIALPFVAIALGPPPLRLRAGEPRRAARVALGLVTVVVLAGLAAPYLSVRFVDNALHRAKSDAAAAERDLGRAADLNPLSAVPHLERGSLALKAGRYPDARLAFERALEVEDAWYPHYALALLDAHYGRFGPARSRIERAAALNGEDHLIDDAAAAIAERRRLDPRALAARPATAAH